MGSSVAKIGEKFFKPGAALMTTPSAAEIFRPIRRTAYIGRSCSEHTRKANVGPAMMRDGKKAAYTFTFSQLSPDAGISIHKKGRGKSPPA